MNFSFPKQILIATNNKGKFREISDLLKEINIEAISTFEFNNLVEPEENGSNFEENSLIKAKYYGSKTNLVALADDSGLCIDAMDGKPGIHSARFTLDENGEKNFPNAFKKIENEIRTDNNAHFICNLSLFDPKTGFSISFEGRVDGKLNFPAKGKLGFGYDPIFIKDGMDKTFGEIDPQTKDQISHRGDAFKKLKNWLVNLNSLPN